MVMYYGSSTISRETLEERRDPSKKESPLKDMRGMCNSPAGASGA